MGSAGRIAGLLLAAAVAAAGGAPAADAADGFVAFYSVTWAGLPAADIRLEASSDGGAYRDAIEIASKGVPRLLARFRGTASAAGRFPADREVEPVTYDTVYDLRKRHGSRISMRFVARDGARVAERGPGDSSRKPPLAEEFRRNVVDPLAAFERIREALRRHRDAGFAIPAYDGARRFDILGQVLPHAGPADGLIHVELRLRPIAGFKGETSEDGDPDDAPRVVALALTDDARLMPVSLSVPIWFLPAVVRLDYACPAAGAAPLRPVTASDADSARRNCRR